ncbi:MAG: lysylphosphatidylglycerol synthase transmembrane domain-containing protein [Candidatus Hydrogenedentota bacterium]
MTTRNNAPENVAATETPPPPPRRWWRGAVRVVVGVVVAAVLLWFLFRGTDWAELWRALANISWPWFLLAQVAGWATYFTRAARWHRVALAVRPVAFRPVFSATQVGQLVNLAVIPRLGELLRAVMLTRISPLRFGEVLSTAALDRVTDMLALLLFLLMSLAVFPLDTEITLPGAILDRDAPLVIPTASLEPAILLLGAVVLGGLLTLVLLYVRRDWMLAVLRWGLRPFPARFSHQVIEFFAHFADGMHVFRSWRGLAMTLYWALMTWGFTLLTVDLVFRAFELNHPWYAAIVATTLLSVFLMVNVTPGFVGQFHLAVIAGVLLTTPGTPPVKAKAVAIVSHVCALYPTVILGVWALMRERIGLGQLLRRTREARGDN